MNLDKVVTNIVYVDVAVSHPPADALAAALAARGVLVLPVGPRRLRFVTHLDVDRAACEQAARIVAETLR